MCSRSWFLSGIQWSPCGDYLLCVDEKPQITVSPLEGPEASPTLRQVARLAPRSDGCPLLFSLFCETCWCVTERDDEMLAVYSLSCIWPGVSAFATSALFTPPIKQLTSFSKSAIDTFL